MEHYALAPEEMLLFRGNVTRSGEAIEAKLILTNLQLVLIQPDGVCVEKHPVGNIKIYKDVPQIFLTNRCVDTARELLTGKTKLARGAGKVKKAMDDVNEAFGVDVLEEAKNFSVNTITHIVSNTKPTLFKLLTSKKKKKQTKEMKK